MPNQRSTSEAAEHVGQYLELQAVVLRSSLHGKVEYHQTQYISPSESGKSWISLPAAYAGKLKWMQHVVNVVGMEKWCVMNQQTRSQARTMTKES